MDKFSLDCMTCCLLRKLGLLKNSKIFTSSIEYISSGPDTKELHIDGIGYELKKVKPDIFSVYTNSKPILTMGLSDSVFDPDLEMRSLSVEIYTDENIQRKDEFYRLRNGTILVLSIEKNSITSIRTIITEIQQKEYNVEIVSVDGSYYSINSVDNLWMALLTGMDGHTKQIYAIKSCHATEQLWIMRYKNTTTLAFSYFYPNQMVNTLCIYNSDIRYDLFRFRNSRIATLSQRSYSSITRAEDIELSSSSVTLTDIHGTKTTYKRNQSGTKVSFRH